MVCVDTSVWIAVWRRKDDAVEKRLRELIVDDKVAFSGQIWVELVGGFRSEARRRANVARVRVYPWLDTTREAYELAAEWVARFRGFGAGDAIIAATAFTNDCELWTLDRSFEPLRNEGLRLV